MGVLEARFQVGANNVKRVKRVGPGHKELECGIRDGHVAPVVLHKHLGQLLTSARGKGVLRVAHKSMAVEMTK